MLKAGALIYAVIISFIFVLISGSIILLKYQSLIYQEVLEREGNLMLNANSGVNLLLANWKEFEENTPITSDLFENGTDSVTLKTRQWGLFRLMVSEAKHRGSKFAKVCLSACRPDTSLALYLANKDDALSVSGKTVIKGDCYLPKAGVKRAYIEGQTFQGDKMINGSIEVAGKKLPTIDKHLIDENLKLLNGFFTINDSVISLGMITSDSIHNSFLKKTLVITSEVPIMISGLSISGNVIIWSKEEIVVERNSALTDVLICGPEVTIESGFEGSLHIVSSQEINIGEGCILNYPSSIALLREKAQETEKTTIKISTKTKLKGAVLLYEEQTNFRNPSLVSIGEEVEIEGQVYTNGNLEHRGKVQGNVYCNEFFLKTLSSTYGNHLLNAEINISELSKLYGGLRVKDEQAPEYIVAKWVN